MKPDRDGSLWVAASYGVRRLKEGQWSTLGGAQGCPDEASAVALAADGQLWGTTLSHVFCCDRATGRCVPTPLQKANGVQSERMQGFRI